MEIESKRNLQNDQELEEIFGFWCNVFLKNFDEFGEFEIVIFGIVKIC
jgi:hypothetical protein